MAKRRKAVAQIEPPPPLPEWKQRLIDEWAEFQRDHPKEWKERQLRAELLWERLAASAANLGVSAICHPIVGIGPPESVELLREIRDKLAVTTVEPPRSKGGRPKGRKDPAVKKWKAEARKLKAKGLTDSEVVAALKELGCARARTTINGWLNESIS